MNNVIMLKDGRAVRVSLIQSGNTVKVVAEGENIQSSRLLVQIENEGFYRPPGIGTGLGFPVDDDGRIKEIE